MNLCTFNFDKLLQTIPPYPFPQLSEINVRANKLLLLRSPKEIIKATEIIGLMNEYYFDIEDAKGWDQNDVQSTNDIATPLNTSDLIALQNSINVFDLDDPGFPKGKDFEYFAVFALWLLADAIDWLNLEEGQTKCPPIYLPFNDKEITAISGSEAIEKIRLAGIMSIDAMNAICHAEMLANADLTAEEKFKRNISFRSLQSVHERNRKFIPLRDLAYKLYQEGKWESPKHAAKYIYPKVSEFGKSIKVKLSENSGEETVYKWLLNYEREIKP